MHKIHNAVLIKIFVYSLLILLVTACDKTPEERQVKTLKIGLLPDRDPATLTQQYTLLFDYISKKVNKPYQLIIPKDYSELVDLFKNQSVDLAFFGGYTFVEANKSDGAVPLVMRDIDRKFLSVIAANKGKALNNIEDLQGTRFSFGSKLSTSGHLMPRYYMSKMNIFPEKYFSTVEYSQAHNKTLENVANGLVDAGVLNANVYNQMTKNDAELAEKVKVIWQSRPYPDYVWAGQSYLEQELQNDLILAFLSLNYDQENEKIILEGLDAQAFFPATINDFNELKKAIALLEQMNE